MKSSDNYKSGLLSAGGILTVIGGAFEVIGGGAIVALVVSPGLRGHLLPEPPVQLPAWSFTSTWLTLLGVSLLVLGVTAVLGGFSAVRRRNYRLSLAGAICALPSAILGWYLAVIGLTVLTGIGALQLAVMGIGGLALVVLGVLAVVCVPASKREFGGERREGGTVDRTGLLTAGGVLGMIDGTLEVVGGAIMLSLVIANRGLLRGLPPGTYAGIRSSLFGWVDLVWLINVGVPLLVLGIVAIAGGVSAVTRRIFGLSLAGAICALPSVIFTLYLGWAIGVGINGALTALVLGILAVVLVSVSKRGFRAKGAMAPPASDY